MLWPGGSHTVFGEIGQTLVLETAATGEGRKRARVCVFSLERTDPERFHRPTFPPALLEVLLHIFLPE